MKYQIVVFSLLCLLCITSIGCWGKKDESSSQTQTATDPAAKPTPVPQVKVETSKGDFIIQLAPATAPKTTEQFIKNVNNGLYNNSLVHEVVKDTEILIGGVKSTTGLPDSGEIVNEANAENSNVKWSVAMLHAPDKTESDSLQFFINMNNNPELDFHAPGTTPQTCGYCVFGTVINGQEVLEQINQVSVVPSDDFEFAPTEEIQIIKISVL